MSRRTLREYLRIPNPKLTILKDAAEASAAKSEDRDPVSEWEPWDGFGGDIEAIFGNLLNRQFEVADPPPLPYAQQQIRDERSFEFILTRWNNVIVNEALRVACDFLGLTPITWTVGTSVLSVKGNIIRPDWAGVTDDMFTEGYLRTSLVPGDTKFAPRNLDAYDGADAERIVKAAQVDSDGFPISSPAQPMRKLRLAWLEQVNYYAFRYSTRYCYVISNQELLLVRRTEDPPIPLSISVARTRERRRGNARETTPIATPTSPTTMMPVSPSVTRRADCLPATPSTSLAIAVMPSSPPEKFRADLLRTPSSSGRLAVPSSPLTEQSQSSPYMDDGNPAVTIEMLSIPWEDDNLTVNLALFALHMLALLSRDVRSS